MERPWQQEAERLLTETFRGFCAAVQQPLPPAGLRINPALSPVEAKYFVLGLEEGVFELNAEGRVRSSVLSLVVTDEPGQVFLVFEHEPLPPRLRREAV